MPAKENIKLRLHSLTYTLLYPAVLGTMIVYYLQGLGTLQAKEHAICIFLILYFCSQHVEGTVNNNFQHISEFAFDVIEIAAIYQMFVLLGLTPAIGKLAGPFSSETSLYIVLAATLSLPLIKVGLKLSQTGINNLLSVGAIVIALILILANNAPFAPILIFILYLLLLGYFAYLTTREIRT